MSATVDATRFSNYLDGAPVLQVPGRTFPVETRFLEDAIELTDYKLERDHAIRDDADDEMDIIEDKPDASDSDKYLQGYANKTRNTITEMNEYRVDYRLIVKLLEQVASNPHLSDYSKAILVFLPGIAEIRQLNDLLSTHQMFGAYDGWYVYPLHSTIASEDQESAFLVPPHGIRKIVLATNIAETGVTIPDITCVIDTGKHKEMRFDERRQLSRLIETFISRANAKQRRGRAGRVQPGLCFHLFTRYRHDRVVSDCEPSCRDHTNTVIDGRTANPGDA
jgi:ATP-dependent RNA helicase DHX29